MSLIMLRSVGSGELTLVNSARIVSVVAREPRMEHAGIRDVGLPIQTELVLGIELAGAPATIREYVPVDSNGREDVDVCLKRDALEAFENFVTASE